MTSRSAILGRIRAASPLEARPRGAVERRYRGPAGAGDPDRLAASIAAYEATVVRVPREGVAAAVAIALAQSGACRVAVPGGLDPAWLPEGSELVADDPPLTPSELDRVDAVLTTCALAIAETGTIVLDHGPGQGRRALSLVPDVHVVVVPVAAVVATVPDAVLHLEPTRPQTWISGPSATSDIELDRVEGVHGPRALHVILVG